MFDKIWQMTATQFSVLLCHYWQITVQVHCVLWVHSLHAQISNTPHLQVLEKLMKYLTWILFSLSTALSKTRLNICFTLDDVLPWDFACNTENIWAAAWHNQQNDMCIQQRLRSAWSSTHSLPHQHEETLCPQLLNDTRRFPGWSESSLGA